MMSAPHWEHFAHDADIGIRGYGTSLEEAFAQIALALSAVITDPARVAPATAVEIKAAATDPELLLVDWLNALVFAMATQKFLFSRFEVHIQDTNLVARAWSERIDAARHTPAVEVKGATYTELRVAQLADGGRLTQCVVDV